MRAQTNAALPAHDEKTDAVVLYAETTVTVQPNGRIKKLDREVVKILRPDGEAQGTIRVYFDPLSRITDLHGWCIPVSGKDYEVKEKDAVESAVIGVDGGELVDDQRTKPSPSRLPPSAASSATKSNRSCGPTSAGRVAVSRHDSGARGALHACNCRRAGPTRRIGSIERKNTLLEGAPGQWRWSIGDVRAIRVERDMPPWRGIAGSMVVAIVPPTGQDPRHTKLA